MKIPITSKKIELVIKKTTHKESPHADGFTGKFYQTFEEERIPILHKLFQKTDKERTLTKSFCDASITLISKPHRDIRKKL